MLSFVVNGQKLIAKVPKIIVSDTINYLGVSVSYDDDIWNALDKWLHFELNGKVYDLRVNEYTTIDLRDGLYDVYLHGSNSEMRIVTDKCKVKVIKSGVLNGKPIPDIPMSAAEQISAESKEAIDAVNKIRQDVDDGKLDGFSPTISVSKSGNITAVTFTDKEGVKTAYIFDGAKGDPGENYVLTEKDKSDIAGMVHVEEVHETVYIENPYNDQPLWKEMSGKVSKEAGKDLSTNDYTTVEKQKLAGIEEGAEKNQDLSPYAKTEDVNAALADKVSKVEGKGLSTNDYTTAEKQKLAGIEDGAEKNPTDYENLRSEVNAQNEAIAKKTGYIEFDTATGKLMVYADETKGTLLAEVPIPTADLTDYVKNTDYATSDKGGTTRVGNGFAVTQSGEPRANVVNSETYGKVDGYYFMSKGTFENIIPQKVKDNLDGVEANLVDLDKPWVLKGTLTTENKDSRLYVDFSDCTELIIKGNVVGTNISSLSSNISTLMYDIVASGGSSRRVFGFWVCEYDSLIPVAAHHGALTAVALGSNIPTYIWFGKKLSDILEIHFGRSENVTSCNIEIYAR